jgi:hypothetical protein
MTGPEGNPQSSSATSDQIGEYQVPPAVAAESDQQFNQSTSSFLLEQFLADSLR